MAEKELWTLEHSQYSEDNKLFPFHVQTLKETVEDNMRDYLHNNRGQNKWQVIFVGTQEQCSRLCDELVRRKSIPLWSKKPA